MTSPYVGQSGRFFACGIRIRKILTSGIRNAGLRNPEDSSRIRNPTERLESGVQVSLTKNTESSTWNPESKSVRAIFVRPWKVVSVSVHYLFYQPMDEKIKTRTLRFPTKENPNMRKALLDWPMVLQHDVKAKYRLISRKFSGMRSFFTRAFA